MMQSDQAGEARKVKMIKFSLGVIAAGCVRLRLGPIQVGRAARHFE